MGEDGTNVLHTAAYCETPFSVVYFIEKGVSVDIRDGQGMSALHHAIFRGNDDVVKYLLGFDANVNAKDNKGRTPLHYAVENFHAKTTSPMRCVEFLLRGGANREEIDNSGKTAL